MYKMKIKICKAFNIISYVLAAILGIICCFTVYDWVINQGFLEYEFWQIIHTNAKYMLRVSLIGIVFPLISYISNFRDDENKKIKNIAEVLMSVFLIGIAAAVVLLLCPIELSFM